MEPLIPDKIPRTEGYAPRGFNPLIKFTHEEVKALLDILDDIDGDGSDGLNQLESSCREKLKRIYARQILSHEKREQDIRNGSE